LKDWLTWYFLGNAYFSNFIANCKKLEELENAEKAYNESVSFISFRKSISKLNIPICTSIEPMSKLILKSMTKL
jgi:transposase-like protein